MLCVVCNKEIKGIIDLVKIKLLDIGKRLYFHRNCYFFEYSIIPNQDNTQTSKLIKLYNKQTKR